MTLGLLLWIIGGGLVGCLIGRYGIRLFPAHKRGTLVYIPDYDCLGRYLRHSAVGFHTVTYAGRPLSSARTYHVWPHGYELSVKTGHFAPISEDAQ